MKITKLNNKVIIIDGEQARIDLDSEGETMTEKAKKMFTFEGFEGVEFHITNFVFVPKEKYLDFRITINKNNN